jgi:hypothetical protein
MTGIEPVTSSLPRKHSTPELHRQAISLRLILWGEQDSNLRRFPNGFTVRPRWPLEYLPQPFTFQLLIKTIFEPIEGLEPTTC